jgi:glutamyl-tRNA synthetase
MTTLTHACDDLSLCPWQRWEVAALGDGNMRNLRKGDIIQLERKGYFIVDRPLISAGKPLVRENCAIAR